MTNKELIQIITRWANEAEADKLYAQTIKHTLIMILEIALRCKDLEELITALREMITKA